MKNVVGLLAVALMCICGAASANIVYNVNIIAQPCFIGPCGTDTVTGTITTDGDIGTLTAGDITAWDLHVAGFLNFSINSTLAGAMVICSTGDCGLNATASALVFNFADPNAFLDFQVLGRSISLNNEVVACPPNCVPLMTVIDSPFFDIDVVISGGTIGTAAVPEPGTLTLLGLALAGLGFARKRSRGRQSTTV